MAHPCSMRRGRACALLTLLCAFALLPALAGETLLDDLSPEGGTQVDAVLYFRYADTAWLAPESRRLTVPHTQTVEEAIVRALILGPSSHSPYLSRLIPRAAEVLAVQENEGLLFVTLSGAFLDPLPDETQAGAERADAVLRRQLMAASLANALTQNGHFHSIQLLVMREDASSTSMRLSARAFLEDSDRLLEPITRTEEDILTPGRALAHILSFWKTRDFGGMRPLIATAGLEGGIPSLDSDAMSTLLDYETSPGTPSPDGSYAVVTLSIRGMDRKGEEKELKGYAIRLEKQDNVWKINRDSLASLADALGGAP